MGAVVGLPWLIEGIAVLAVFFTAPDRTSLVLAGIGGVLEAIVIAVTVLRSIPAHERLTSGYDADAHRRLVQTNWLRTGAWSARGLIAIALVVLAATQSAVPRSDVERWSSQRPTALFFAATYSAGSSHPVKPPVPLDESSTKSSRYPLPGSLVVCQRMSPSAIARPCAH